MAGCIVAGCCLQVLLKAVEVQPVSKRFWNVLGLLWAKRPCAESAGQRYVVDVLGSHNESGESWHVTRQSGLTTQHHQALKCGIKWHLVTLEPTALNS